MTAGACATGPGRHVVLALGSNLGERLANLQAGIDALGEGAGLCRAAVSPVYETVPVGGPQQPDYLNAVLVADTALTAWEVLRRCQAAENARGRERGERWGPRTLDIDIVACGEEIRAGPELTLPHPRAHERAFVLAPWHDLEPQALLPGRGPVADLLAAAGGGGVRKLAGLRLTVAGRPGPQQ